jgi:hypothetical protein
MNIIINISNIKKFQKLLTPSNLKQVVKIIKCLIPFCKSKKSDKITPIENNIDKVDNNKDEPIIIQFYDESEIPHEIKIFNKLHNIEIYNSSQPYKNNIIYDKLVYKYENFNNLFIDINNNKYKNNTDYKYEIKLSNNLFILFN